MLSHPRSSTRTHDAKTPVQPRRATRPDSDRYHAVAVTDAANRSRRASNGRTGEGASIPRDGNLEAAARAQALDTARWPCLRQRGKQANLARHGTEAASRLCRRSRRSCRRSGTVDARRKGWDTRRRPLVADVFGGDRSQRSSEQLVRVVAVEQPRPEVDPPREAPTGPDVAAQLERALRAAAKRSGVARGVICSLGKSP